MDNNTNHSSNNNNTSFKWASSGIMSSIYMSTAQQPLIPNRTVSTKDAAPRVCNTHLCVESKSNSVCKK